MENTMNSSTLNSDIAMSEHSESKSFIYLRENVIS